MIDSDPPAVRLSADGLLVQLGMRISPEMFEHALTHRSYAYEQGGLPTNERLEFLGDSVLGLVVTEHLFRSYPEHSEGQLAKLRAAVVNSRALADVARDLDLGALVRLGRGEETTGGRDKSSILADTMEAVIGAVFLEHGIDAARIFVHSSSTISWPRSPPVAPGWTGRRAFRRSRRCPGWGCRSIRSSESGPDHAKSFQAMVVIGESTYGPGAGRNKKEAEQNAAAVAFAALKNAVSGSGALKDAVADAVPDPPSTQ